MHCWNISISSKFCHNTSMKWSSIAAQFNKLMASNRALKYSRSPHAQVDNEHAICYTAVSTLFPLSFTIHSLFSLQAWTDNKLKWDPAKYGGIKVVRLPWDSIWKPDILLYNK